MKGLSLGALVACLVWAVVATCLEMTGAPIAALVALTLVVAIAIGVVDAKMSGRRL